jgi:polygalacturonase
MLLRRASSAVAILAQSAALLALPASAVGLGDDAVSQAAASVAPASRELPSWVNQVGAARAPSGRPAFEVSAYGAVGDGVTPATAAIQKAIDACAAAGGGLVTFRTGTYLTGAIFVKSHVHLRIDAGVTLLGTLDESAYPILPTRVAGIEMPWPAALINVDGQEDVEVSGKGSIDGQGDFWWKKYWALRKSYVPRGIRWAADYDCQRVRLIVAYDSKDVTLAGLCLRRSGFWTVQITYCDRVTVDGITIADNAVIGGVKGPSTDGVDIDSSQRVLVQNCDIDNNDDDICLKAGRDSDGLRVNRPTEYVVIRDNVCRRGGGVLSFGSETSGGIRHVVAYRDSGIGTSEGLRFKSARTRGGTLEDILIYDIRLSDVPLPFTFTLDWNPTYSYASIPPGMKDVPAYWKVLATRVEPPEKGFANFRDITIESVTATGARRILTAAGLAEKPLGAVRWQNVSAQGLQAGEIRDARNWTMKNVEFTTADGAPVKLTNCQNVETPVIARGN